jgi:hypothetical protein
LHKFGKYVQKGKRKKRKTEKTKSEKTQKPKQEETKPIENQPNQKKTQKKNQVTWAAAYGPSMGLGLGCMMGFADSLALVRALLAADGVNQ